MVTITVVHQHEISLEKFINACSHSQLYELELLLNKKLNQIEEEMGMQEMDRAAMKHKILTQKREE